ncbi:MAG: hypothetical protein ACFFCF_11395 [Promethearchaeota archaeon]
MGKRDDFIIELKPLITFPEKLEKFLTENSNLPGPRGNLELAFALSEIYEDLDVLLEWTEITEDQATVNDPKSFLAFCAAICLGKIYTKTKDPKLIRILKHLADDGRWRMREAVAFGFQIIGEHDFNELKAIFSDWIREANNLEKRAILVSLAHPPFLTEERTKFCFKITDEILLEIANGENFDVLRKGLEFTLSVFAAANPALGFRFMRKWIGKRQLIDRILVKNLKKKRLVKRNPEEVKHLLGEIHALSHY